MNWNSYPEIKPKSSGSYLASVKRHYAGGNDLVFKCVIHYDHRTDKWFKYDPFLDENSIQEEIARDMILGWLAGIPSYLG